MPQGIPEVSASLLTARLLRSAIRRHGCLLVRKLVDPSRAEPLLADIDRAFTAYDAFRAPESPKLDTDYFAPIEKVAEWELRDWIRGSGGVLTVDSPRALFNVLEAFEDAGIPELVTDFFGQRPLILGHKWTLRRISHKAPTGVWHQDGAFLGRDISALNLWVALSQCGEKSPTVDVVPRRFDEIVPIGTEGAVTEWCVSDQMADQVSKGHFVRAKLNPGDALLFDHMLLHRTGVSPQMHETRYALESWFYCPAELSQESGRYFAY